MDIRIIDRKYLIGGKWLRFEKMKGIFFYGWKIAIGRYEIRFYLKQASN
jgi:hypothetical protein